MARSGNCWKRLAAIPPKAKKAAQTCQITHLGSRWSRVTPPRLRREAKTSTLSGVGPAVRIPSPPAVSRANHRFLSAVDRPNDDRGGAAFSDPRDLECRRMVVTIPRGLLKALPTHFPPVVYAQFQ